MAVVVVVVRKVNEVDTKFPSEPFLVVVVVVLL
jgi:hypothetical protein